jgi:hypothetical protein
VTPFISLLTSLCEACSPDYTLENLPFNLEAQEIDILNFLIPVSFKQPKFWRYSLFRDVSQCWLIDSSWNVMVHGDALEGKWRGNWRMEWVVSTLHTTLEHVVSSITTIDAHNWAASIRQNWRHRRFKWTRPFRRKTKSGFCACAITFQTQSTYLQ